VDNAGFLFKIKSVISNGGEGSAAIPARSVIGNALPALYWRNTTTWSIRHLGNAKTAVHSSEMTSTAC
jgi:hypothetical protein